MSKFQKNDFWRKNKRKAKNPVFYAVFAVAKASKKLLGESVNAKFALFRPFLALVCAAFIFDCVEIGSEI